MLTENYFEEIKKARKTADLVKKIRNDEVVVFDEGEDVVLLEPEMEEELSPKELKDTVEMFLDMMLMEEAAANMPKVQRFGISRTLIDTELRKKIHKTAKDIVKLPDGWTLEAVVAGGAKQLNDMMELLVGEDDLPAILTEVE